MEIPKENKISEIPSSMSQLPAFGKETLLSQLMKHEVMSALILCLALTAIILVNQEISTYYFPKC